MFFNLLVNQKNIVHPVLSKRTESDRKLEGDGRLKENYSICVHLVDPRRKINFVGRNEGLERLQ